MLLAGLVWVLGQQVWRSSQRDGVGSLTGDQGGLKGKSRGLCL